MYEDPEMMILHSDMFCSWREFLDSATAIQLGLPLYTLQNTSEFGRCISRIKETSLINAIKVLSSRIAWLNAMYFAFAVFKEISVCNLMHHNNGHPVYVINITYVTWMLCIIWIWLGPPNGKFGINVTIGNFLYIRPVNYAACDQPSIYVW